MSDPRKVAAEIRFQELLDAARQVMGTRAGRLLVVGLVETTNVWGRSMGAEPAATAYNEGRRSVGIELLDFLADACGPRIRSTLLREQEDWDEIVRERAASSAPVEEE